MGMKGTETRRLGNNRAQEWVSVENELPSDHQGVLIACDTSDLWPGHYTYWLSLYCEDRGEFRGYDVYEDLFEPTHWMYLPEPPNAKEKKYRK